VTGQDLKLFPLLAALADEDRDALADHLVELSLDAGVRVFAEGDVGEGLGCVVAGRLLLSSGEAGALGELGPGQTFGSLSLVARGARAASLQTLSPTCLYLLSRDAYRRLATYEPRAACGLLEAVLREHAQLVREGVADRLCARG